VLSLKFVYNISVSNRMLSMRIANYVSIIYRRQDIINSISVVATLVLLPTADDVSVLVYQSILVHTNLSARTVRVQVHYPIDML
jgi:hypothetical protein